MLPTELASQAHLKVQIPMYTWKIMIGGGSSSTTFMMGGKVPNRFNRFMYKLLLGWKIDKV